MSHVAAVVAVAVAVATPPRWRQLQGQFRLLGIKNRSCRPKRGLCTRTALLLLSNPLQAKVGYQLGTCERKKEKENELGDVDCFIRAAECLLWGVDYAQPMRKYVRSGLGSCSFVLMEGEGE
jgi:hypothetical protein